MPAEEVSVAQGSQKARTWNSRYFVCGAAWHCTRSLQLLSCGSGRMISGCGVPRMLSSESQTIPESADLEMSDNRTGTVWANDLMSFPPALFS